MRDLLKLAEPVLNDPMLLAIAESGNNPNACFDRMVNLGLKNHAAKVKAAVLARTELGKDAWKKVKVTSVRPAESMLRFVNPGPAGALVASTHHVIAGQEYSHVHWPLLLKEFSLTSREENPRTLTSLDYNGRELRVYDNPDDLFRFMNTTNSLPWAETRFSGWKVAFRDWGCSFADPKYRLYVRSETVLLAEPSKFSRCYKVVEIRQSGGNGEGVERIRVRLRKDNLVEPDDTMTFERLVPVGNRFALKLSVPFHIFRPGGKTGFKAAFNEYGFCKGGITLVYEYGGVTMESSPDPPFQLQAPTGQDPFRELCELAERISAVKELDMEPVVGQMFIDNPPEHLHYLFVKN